MNGPSSSKTQESRRDSHRESRQEKPQTGRGLVAITAAKVYFILVSYGVQLALPRLLGSPEEFGRFSKVISVIAMLNNVLIVATIQSVSKFTSENEHNAPALLRQAWVIQCVLGGSLACGVMTSAPWFAAFHSDSSLLPMVRVAGMIFVAYALYAAVVGSLNGQHRFTTQARLDMTFSTLRTLGILGGAAMGLGAFGALTGFTLAAWVVMLIALMVVGRAALTFKASGVWSGIPLKTWLTFMAPIWLYQAFINGVLQIDIQVLSKTLADMGLADGLSADAASYASARYVGFYRAAQTFAFVPYQLIVALTFILFPTISKAIANGDLASAKSSIQQSLRFSFLLLLAIATPISGAAQGVLRIAYQEEYLVGGPALRVLVLGVAVFAFFVVLATVLSSAGQPGIAALLGAVGLGVVIVATSALVTKAGLHHTAMEAAAWGTTAGTCTACIAAAAVVFLRFHTLVSPWTLLRGTVAGIVAYFAAQAIPHDTRFMAIVALAGGFLAFLFILGVLGEVRRHDLQAMRHALRR